MRKAITKDVIAAASWMAIGTQEVGKNIENQDNGLYALEKSAATFISSEGKGISRLGIKWNDQIPLA